MEGVEAPSGKASSGLISFQLLSNLRSKRRRLCPDIKKRNEQVPIAESGPLEENPSWTNLPLRINLKEETMDDIKNDSGVASGSSPSVSPGSDRSETNQKSSPINMETYEGSLMVPQYISTDVWHQVNLQRQASNQANQELDSDNHNRNSVSPKSEMEMNENSNESEFSLTPKSDNHEEEDGFKHPKLNSHGKVKILKCKQCEYFTYTKKDYWEHCRLHIRNGRLLCCPKCPFVTEYKHHLEYHILNHSGVKPFKCKTCAYSCINKSMLNSHLKSHSKVYQYRCADCNYETKYCHSLKLHLRKYRHRPDIVLNPDGTPNPYPVIDVYGTRRGPKVKKHSEPNTCTSPENNIPQAPQMPIPLFPFINQNSGLTFPIPPMLPPFMNNMPPFPENVPPEVLLSFHKILKDELEKIGHQNLLPLPNLSQALDYPQENNVPADFSPNIENGALDLTNKSDKGSEYQGDGDDSLMTVAFENVEVVEDPSPDESKKEVIEVKKEIEDDTDMSVEKTYLFKCTPCRISFGEEVLYRIHMGYHGFKDPFTCNLCGTTCKNSLEFNLHIAKVGH